MQWSFLKLHKEFILALVLLLVTVVSLLALTAEAAFNENINYQGKLTDNTGATVADGTYNVEFKLYTQASGGAAIWTETASTSVANGLFSYMLGSTSPLTGVDFNQTLYLGVNIGGTGSPSWDGEMTPRKVFGAVPAAFEAKQFDGLATTSFLRSDQADTVSGLLTFTGGIISSASSTVANLNFTAATGTTLVINGDQISDFTGSGLTLSGGALTANISESNLNIVAAPTDGYVLQASSTATGGFVWQATSSLGITEDLTDNSISELSDVTIASAADGEILMYSGGAWVDAATSSLNINTDDLTEGSTNLFWTNQRFDTRLNATTTLPSLTTLANLVTVGALDSGSITSNFGNIDIGSSNLDADGTITFAGLSNGVIQAVSGVLSASTSISSAVIEDAYVFNTGDTMTGALTMSGANIILNGEWLSGDGDDEGVFVSTAGDVGVGTTSPSSKLTVWGGFTVATGTTPAFEVDTASGRVAIGTSTLNTTARLAIAGGNTKLYLDTITKGAVYTEKDFENIERIGDYLYLLAYQASGDDFYVYDVSNGTPVNLSSLNVSDVGGNGAVTGGLAISDNYAYLATGSTTKGLVVVDISDPFNPVEVGSTILAGSADPYDITLSGKYLFVGTERFSGGNDIIVYDISNPTQPTFVSSKGTTGTSNNTTIIVQDDRLYSADTNLSQIAVLDISDVYNMVETDTYVIPGDPLGLEVDGNILYVGLSTRSDLHIFDVSSSTNVSFLASTSVGHAIHEIKKVGDYLLVGGSNLTVLDVSSSTNPKLVATQSASGGILDFVVRGSEVYTANINGANDIEQYFLNNLNAPIIDSGSIFANNISTVNQQVERQLSVFGGLSVGQNAIINGALAISGASEAGSFGSHTNPALTVASGNIIFGTTTGAARLTVQSNGTNDVLNLFETGGAEVFTVLESGLVGVGSSTPLHTFSVNGDLYANGALYDNTNSAGTNGMVLQSTGTGFNWVATSSLGIGTSLFTDGGNDIYLTSLTDSLNIGTTSSSSNAKLTVWGDMAVGTSGTPTLLVDASANSVTATNFNFTAATGTTLTIGTDSITDFTGTGLSVTNGTLNVSSSSLNLTYLGLSDTPSSFTANAIPYTNAAGNALVHSANLIFTGQGLGISTSSVNALLTMGTTSFTGSGTAGIDQYFSFSNSVQNAIEYGNKMYYSASNNTATTTMVGGIIRLEDGTTFGNTIRGFEVQTNRGGNTQGENTALSGFARTFGVRGYSSGDAGGRYEPAGGFFETGGTTQGNAIRGYSETITTADLLSLYQASSTFEGTGLKMNFGNGTGSFSSSTASRFVDFQNAGTSKFIVYEDGSATIVGTTTIGAGTTATMAGLQIGYGGICVDNDGSCTASTTGRISAVSYGTYNSDLAEMYFSSQSLEPGELVVADEFISVKRATLANKDLILGVVSTKPGITMGSDDTPLKTGQTGYPLALTGRVPVRLSTENGAIEPGDMLTLSSIPGIAMKANPGDVIVGRALESFDGTYAYTEGFVNQFGDDIAKPDYQIAEELVEKPQKADCYFGGGGASDATSTPDCDPNDVIEELTEETGPTAEEIAQARYEAEQVALQALRDQAAEDMIDGEGNDVRVGQVVMFVQGGRYFSNEQIDVLAELISTSTELVLGAKEGSGETLWDRLRHLAQNFVDGVLAVAGIKADKVETSELCVDDVCVTANDLRALLKASNNEGQVVEVTPVQDMGSGSSTGSSEVVDNGGNAEVATSDNSDNEQSTSTESAATTSQTTALDQGTSSPEVIETDSDGSGAVSSDSETIVSEEIINNEGAVTGGEESAPDSSEPESTEPEVLVDSGTIDPTSEPEPEPEPIPEPEPEPTPDPAPSPEPPPPTTITE